MSVIINDKCVKMTSSEVADYLEDCDDDNDFASIWARWDSLIHNEVWNKQNTVSEHLVKVRVWKDTVYRYRLHSPKIELWSRQFTNNSWLIKKPTKAQLEGLCMLDIEELCDKMVSSGLNPLPKVVKTLLDAGLPLDLLMYTADLNTLNNA